MEDTKIKYSKWLYAIYMILISRKGISSLQLSKEIGVTQKSAWYLCHRIREACESGDFTLDGIVEIDEIYISGKEKNRYADKKLKQGRGPSGKTAVFGMSVRDGKVKAKLVNSTKKESLQGTINNNVKKGATVYTDEHLSYTGLGANYDHAGANYLAKEFVRGMVLTNGIESVWAVLKRSYNGIHHNMSIKHLHRYVDEFTFRLNEGDVEIHVLNRMKFLTRGLFNKVLTY